MATKTLSISETAYTELKKLKKPDESFSQLILRLIEKKGDPGTILKTIENIRKYDATGSDDLADCVEDAYLDRENRKLREVKL